MSRIFALTGLCVAAAFVNAGATVIHVPGDYTSIQAAVNASSRDDTVLVAPNTYSEHVVIDRAISLFGESEDGCIIDGSGQGDVVSVESNSVRLSGFTIKHSGGNLHEGGVKIAFADSCKIEMCRFQNNNAGLCLYQSAFNVITRCRFDLNNEGIHFCESYPGPSRDNLNNSIVNNAIFNNTNNGIFFEHTGGVYHHHTFIKGNLIANNGAGMDMIMSQENDLCYNSIVSNTGYGIRLMMCIGGGMYNRFHHNNFISNRGGAVQATDTGNGLDYWYLVSGEGNHWSDYTGPDDDSNGVGDTPYYIDGAESQDDYPLMNPLHATVKGSVTNASSEPILGVCVLALGTGVSDTTDIDGRFCLDGLGAGIHDVSFSASGYRDSIVAAVPATLSDTTELDVVMTGSESVNDNGATMPSEYMLSQNYPNPFNSYTVIGFGLPKASNVWIEIYDLLGRKVETLISGTVPAGYHHVTWNARAVPTGVYFCRLLSGECSKTRRILLLK